MKADRAPHAPDLETLLENLHSLMPRISPHRSCLEKRINKESVHSFTSIIFFLTLSLHTHLSRKHLVFWRLLQQSQCLPTRNSMASTQRCLRLDSKTAVKLWETHMSTKRLRTDPASFHTLASNSSQSKSLGSLAIRNTNDARWCWGNIWSRHGLDRKQRSLLSMCWPL